MTSLFFGDTPEIARYDVLAYPQLDRLTERQNSLFWRETATDVSLDKAQFESLSEAEQHIFTSNLKYQILLDTIQGREPVTTFLPHASVPELETMLTAWAYFETIHSRAYTHIIRNIYNDASEVFDTIMDIPEIQERSKTINKYYDDFKQNPNIDTLYLCLNQVNVLEGVRFYASFACSFAFAERALMTGNANIIKLIARDENTHLAMTQAMIKILRKQHPELEAKHSESVYDMFQQATEQEAEWADYLFSKGTMLGLNADILKTYTEYICNTRLRALGMLPLYPVNTNPLPWISAWLNSDSVQVAPQESEISSYLESQLDTSLDIMAFASDYSKII